MLKIFILNHQDFIAICRNSNHRQNHCCSFPLISSRFFTVRRSHSETQSSIEVFGMVSEMVINERCNKVVTVIVALKREKDQMASKTKQQCQKHMHVRLLYNYHCGRRRYSLPLRGAESQAHGKIWNHLLTSFSNEQESKALTSCNTYPAVHKPQRKA